MFVVTKALFISIATVVFCTRVTWVCLECFLLCKEECYSPVSLQLLRGYGIWACMRCLFYVFVGFWDGDCASQLPYVWYYIGVKSSFQHGREEYESRCVLGA